MIAATILGMLLVIYIVFMMLDVIGVFDDNDNDYHAY